MILKNLLTLQKYTAKRRSAPAHRRLNQPAHG